MALITLSEVRDEGLTEAMADDDRVNNLLIPYATEIIEQVTGQWFEPLSLTLTFDGTGTGTLHTGIPIISITSLKVNSSTTALATDAYEVYNSITKPDDRKNPRIKLKGNPQDSIFRVRSGMNAVFMRGHRNQVVEGVFGYTIDNTNLPDLIKRAALMLVMEYAQTAQSEAGSGSGEVTLNPAGPVVEQWVDSHRIRWADTAASAAAAGDIANPLTGNTKVDQILRLYRAPWIVRGSSRPSPYVEAS